ncbi:hypothetical protein LC087_02585 [Bacillus carboniphilus]|uniref:Glycogen biosynthesis protein GlgD n=1 Tax=Bacillus carboniphilus TaxID=86663 RepID=A0ABY9JXQ1_9BACI|nr:hypothetical protein [Bacillus carboniphilus]WLR43113.1 hypothetical protein LC087_02585 [Bacillus carboniphilus]
MKRKVQYNQAQKNNTTPKESKSDTEFSSTYDQENPMKGANRNSKAGSQGEHIND